VSQSVHFSYQFAAPTLGVMTVKSAGVAAGQAGSRGRGAGRGSVLGGLATMTASAASNQVGAAVGAHAFATIGPVGVVAVRQFVAAAVLLPVARPNVRRFTWEQWWPTLLLGLVFATMNLSLYTAIDRIGLGLAVTLEVLGPPRGRAGWLPYPPGHPLRSRCRSRRLRPGVARPQ
jgi:hypothetical protein